MLGLLEKFSRLEELMSQSALKNVDSDQILLMNGISWDIYEALLQGFPNSEFLPNLDLNVLANFVISDEKPREIILKFIQLSQRYT